MLERLVPVLACEPRDVRLEAGRADLLHPPAASAAEMVVVRRSARRVAHAPRALVDGVDAREDLALDEKVEGPEDGRTADAATRELADEVLRRERLRATERSGDDDRPRAGAATPVAAELIEDGPRR